MIDLSKIMFFEKGNPITDEEINEIENELNIELPTVYSDLLHCINGFGTAQGIKIFGTKEIIERNATLEVEEYAKGFVAIGG